MTSTNIQPAIRTPETSSSEPLSSNSDNNPTSSTSESQTSGSATGSCSNHDFSIKHEKLGEGAFGVVYRVSCGSCKMVVAQKEIRLATEGPQRYIEKQQQAMKDELNFLTTLHHPNIVEYVHHEQDQDNRLRIFTEYCELRDLERQFRKSSSSFSPGVIWRIVRCVSSALAKCHSGLNAKSLEDGSDEYYGFEPSWEPIVHRDIKPGNVLLRRTQTTSSSSTVWPTDQDRPEDGDFEDTSVKLGDFGAACRLVGDHKRSTVTGTKLYWAPEIREQALQDLDRATAWSVKTDIWSIGTMIYHFLTNKYPSKSKREPENSTLASRIQALKKVLHGDLDDRDRPSYDAEDWPEALLKITCECLDPCPEKRPTALDILALALKADISEAGHRRSESFWRTLASQPPDQKCIAATTTRHFVAEYLSLIDDTTFSATEACLILSLQSRYSDYDILTSASRLSRGFTGKLENASIFHGIAVATSGDPFVEKLVWDETEWPRLPMLSQMSLREDKQGLLASHVAALLSNIKVAKHLWSTEEHARSEQAKRSIDQAKAQIRDEMNIRTGKEVEFLFTWLRESFNLSYSRTRPVRALVAAASHGYGSTVRNLVNMGVDPSAKFGHRKETALHFAASAGDGSLTSFLLDHQAAVESQDSHRNTPLHCAAWSGHEEVVRVLLGRGANVNAQDYKGRTALFGAASGGFLGVVKVLLANKADHGIRGGMKNQTAEERAEARGFTDIAKMLQNQNLESNVQPRMEIVQS